MRASDVDRESGKRPSRPLFYDLSDVPGPDPEVVAYPIFRCDDERSHQSRRDERTWPMFSADELGRFPPVEWLISGWLAARELTVLYGPGDTYKSFIALTWACQLAASNHTVVYIAAEGISGIRVRIAAWQVFNRVRSLSSLLITAQNVDFHKPPSVAGWIAEVEAELVDRKLPDPVLIVVDTVARNFVGGDENSTKDLGMFVEGCEAVRKSLGAAVVPIHHTRKDATRERGTESLRNASFAMFKTVARGSGSADLECDRMKDAEPPPPVKIEFEQVPLLPLSDWQEGLVSSLAMKRRFPPPTKVEAKEDDDREFLQAVLDVLSANRPLGMEKALAAVRAKGIQIGAQRGRALLNRYAADPSIPIERDGSAGLRCREEA
jgi:hypothetical protein